MRTRIIVGAAVAALAGPAVALGADDADIFPADPPATTTTFGADGSTTTAPVKGSERAFVEQLRASGALAGVYREATGGFRHPTTIRYGIAAPSAPLARISRSASSRRAVTVRWSTQADGTRTMERAYARDVATGTVRRISVDAAKRLSGDPRGGRPGTMYVYSAESGLPAGAPFA